MPPYHSADIRYEVNYPLGLTGQNLEGLGCMTVYDSSHFHNFQFARLAHSLHFQGDTLLTVSY